MLRILLELLLFFSSQYDQKYDIIVLDLDKPWEPFHVTMVTAPVTHLEWNVTGSKLLVIDSHGTCKVWTMKVTA